MNYIYAIFDEDNPSAIPYVGCTMHLNKRINEHFNGNVNTTKDWAKNAVHPQFRVLATCSDRKKALRLEKAWMRKLKSWLNIQRNENESTPFSIRLDSSVYDLLCEIKTKCDWPVTLGVLANYAIVSGIGMTRKAFNPKSKSK